MGLDFATVKLHDQLVLKDMFVVGMVERELDQHVLNFAVQMEQVRSSQQLRMQ